ncbi:MAG: CDP-alcohol phosphatidyltransferase family protein [Granulosicoccus sp.]
MTNSTDLVQEQLNHSEYSQLLKATSKTLALVTACGFVLGSVIYVSLGLGRSFPLPASACWVIVVLLIFRGLPYHRHSKFGTANTVTSFRAAGAIMLAGMLPVSHTIVETSTALWIVSLCIAGLICFDGVDGFFARREKLTSDFGARFDMETDAFLALIVSLLIWDSGRAGIWVLGLGLMRYVFVFWSWFSPPLTAVLFPSMRRKVVCVIQLGALCLMISPLLHGNAIMLVGVTALVCLSASFLVDIVWLYRQASNDSEAGS